MFEHNDCAHAARVGRGSGNQPPIQRSENLTAVALFERVCDRQVKAADASNRYKEGNFILVVPDIVSHPHRGGVVDADTAAAAAARKRKRSSSSAAAAGEGESAASAAASSSDMAPAIPFATLSRSRYSTGGVSRSGSLSSASSAASEGTPPSGSQSSSRSRSIGSSMVDDDEADDGDASIPPDSTSALLSRLRALRRSLGPPQSSGSSAIHQTLASLLPDPHLSPDSPQPQQQQQQQPRSTTGADRGRQLVRAAQLAFISGHPPPPV